MNVSFAAVVGWFKTNPRNIFLIAGLLIVIFVLFTVYRAGEKNAHAKDDARQKIAVAAAIKSDDKADNKSLAVVVREALVIDAKQKELENAVADIPDSTPDAVAVAAGCVELRQHGRSTADLPACRAVGR
jgi:hypothetical protein